MSGSFLRHGVWRTHNGITQASRMTAAGTNMSVASISSFRTIATPKELRANGIKPRGNQICDITGIGSAQFALAAGLLLLNKQVSWRRRIITPYNGSEVSQQWDFLPITLMVQVEQSVMCVCLCLCVWTITSELNDLSSRYMARWFSLTLSWQCLRQARSTRSQVRVQSRMRKVFPNWSVRPQVRAFWFVLARFHCWRHHLTYVTVSNLILRDTKLSKRVCGALCVNWKLCQVKSKLFWWLTSCRPGLRSVTVNCCKQSTVLSTIRDSRIWQQRGQKRRSEMGIS